MVVSVVRSVSWVRADRREERFDSNVGVCVGSWSGGGGSIGGIRRSRGRVRRFNKEPLEHPSIEGLRHGTLPLFRRFGILPPPPSPSDGTVFPVVVECDANRWVVPSEEEQPTTLRCFPSDPPTFR